LRQIVVKRQAIGRFNRRLVLQGLQRLRLHGQRLRRNQGRGSGAGLHAAARVNEELRAHVALVVATRVRLRLAAPGGAPPDARVLGLLADVERAPEAVAVPLGDADAEPEDERAAVALPRAAPPLPLAAALGDAPPLGDVSVLAVIAGANFGPVTALNASALKWELVNDADGSVFDTALIMK
jgi:hypothetical protein